MLPVLGDGLIEAVKVATTPEITFKVFRLATGFLEGKPFAKNVKPREKRYDHQQGHDELYNDTCFQNQVKNRQILCGIHLKASNWVRDTIGIETIFMGLTLTAMISTLGSRQFFKATGCFKADPLAKENS